MNPKYPPSLPGISGLALAVLFLGGCASEKAVLNQTQPLQERMDRVEQNLASSNDATLRAAESHNEALARQQQDLAKQLADVQTGVAQLRDQFNGRDLRLANALAQREEHDKTLNDRLTDIQQQLNNAVTLAQNNARQTSLLRAAESRNEALARQQQDQAKQLADVQTGVAQLRDQFNGRELRSANALAQREEHDKTLNDRLTDTQQQLNNAVTLAQSNARQTSLLQAEQAHAGAHGEKLATEISGANRRIDEISRLAQSTAQDISSLANTSRQNRVDAELADDTINKRLLAAEKKLDTLTGLVHEALALAAKEIFLANGREAFSIALTHDTVLYPQNDPTLDRRDIAKLMELAVYLGKLDQEYHLDIQGHTANTSTEDNNYNLGKARAEVVKRYLNEKQGITISRMSTTSYGASKPLTAANENNRRIFIRVLVLK